MGSHYDVLGLRPSATPAEVRDAYRRLARRHHPDQHHSDQPGGRAAPVVGATSMADVNDAYRVLRDPIRRARYDADLRGRQDRSTTGSAAPGAAWPTTGPGYRTGSPAPIDRTPARYPWKLVGGMAALGVGLVLAGAAFYEPAGPARPDNVLEPGSCVSVELDQAVREVNCDGTDDLVVRALVPSDERCQQGLSAYRDRQGMGLACVSPDTTP